MQKFKIFLALAFLTAVCCAAAFGQGSQIRLVPYISTGLASPLFLTNARDGSNRTFIVQQGGIIRVVQPGSTSPTEFLNITTKVIFNGERGLLGLAFHPQYSANGRFFVYYTRQPDGAIQISEFQVSSNPNVANPTERIILTIPHSANSNHNGGTIAFGPDGYLYAGPGDGGSGNDPPNNAQNVNELLGKILRIDVDSAPTGQQYGIPPDNPFVGVNGRDEIFAVGMRNPYRFSFDRGGTQSLWAADVGQNSWEEVDIITRGGNYGWKILEGSQCANPSTNCVPPANYVPPVFEYSSQDGTGQCSVTGGFVYRGLQGSLPTGGYLYGDYCSGEIRLWNGSQQLLLQDTSKFIVGFGEDESGELYVVAANNTIDRISALTASVSGRIFAPDGRGLHSTSVRLLRGGQNIKTVSTNSAGFYTIEGVDTGQIYTLRVVSRRYKFPTDANLMINGNLTGRDFTATE